MEDGSNDPQLYARSFVDIYDEWYGELGDPSDIAIAVSARLTSARVLELGSGSGRLTGPLTDAGHQVVALDASVEMLARDRSQARRVGGDMAALPLRDGSVDLVLVAWNTFFNLSTLEAQNRSLRDIARVLRPGGQFAIEAFIAAPSPNPACTSRAHPTDPRGRMLIVTGPADPNGVIDGTHLELTSAGVRPRPWRLAYRSPAELDGAAAAAGLMLQARHADWASSGPVTDGARHVSWYARA